MATLRAELKNTPISAGHRTLKALGVTVSREPSLVDFLKSRDVDLVIDVGANIGQFGGELRENGYKGAIVSFEPIKSVFDKLSKRAGRDSSWQVRNAGAGSADARLQINVAQETVFSSIQKPAEFAKEFDPRSSAVRTEDISVVRLDDAIDVDAYRNIFLKIDTQGYEQEVLKGADSLLKRCVGLQLELPIAHLYDDVWGLQQALGYVMSKGFAIAQVRGVSLMPDRASFVELDVVFRRESAA